MNPFVSTDEVIIRTLSRQRRDTTMSRKNSGADLGGGGGGRGGRGPPFQFVGDVFFVKIYNNFIIL